MELPETTDKIRVETPEEAAQWTRTLRAINATFHRISDTISAYLERGGEVPKGYRLEKNNRNGALYLVKEDNKNRHRRR